MALTSRHNPYLVALLFVIITGCSTTEIKGKSPTDTQQPPSTCPLQERDTTRPHSIEEPVSTGILATDTPPLFAETFYFQYDTVVNHLLELPADNLVMRVDNLSQDTLANSHLPSENKTDKPVVNRQVETVLSKARRFIGTPYRRGGTSPRGFDCSGLVYYTLKQTGISVPRSAHDQYLHSTPIKQTELRPGDLVFFKTNRRTSRITHVGIYLGDDRFIHARSGGRKVDITSLSDGYYSTRFVRGGRIL